MIVWGGTTRSTASRNTGGIYDPATDTWTPTSTVGAPTARDYHTAVWTGSKMIVWGGWRRPAAYLNTGGIYDPATEHLDSDEHRRGSHGARLPHRGLDGIEDDRLGRVRPARRRR